MNATRTYVLPPDLEEDARRGRVGSILLDFDLSREVVKLKPGERFKAKAICPAHDDHDPSLIVTVKDGTDGRARAGTVIHYCPVCRDALGKDESQVAIRNAMGESTWARWKPRRAWTKPPPVLDHYAIEVRRRELLTRTEDIANLRDCGVTLDALKVLRVGYERVDHKVFSKADRDLDRLVFYLQGEGRYVGRMLYLPKWRSTSKVGRKITDGRQGVVMRRGGPAAGPVVVCEGAMAALAAQSMGGEAIGTPGTSWSFTKPHRVIFDHAGEVVVFGDSVNGMESAERWAVSIRRWVGEVRLIDFERETGFDIADLLREAGHVSAKRHIAELVVRAKPLPAPRPGPRPDVRRRAIELLQRELANGPVPVQIIEDKATRDDISQRTLKRARVDVGTHSHRADDETSHRWVLTLADSCPICLHHHTGSSSSRIRTRLGPLGPLDVSPANEDQDHVGQVPSEGAQIIDFPGGRHAG